MGAHNKLLFRDRSGRTMIGRVVEAVLASQASEVVVVTGHQAQDVALAVRLAASGSLRLRIIHSPDYARGLAASLSAGIHAVSHAAAALVCLGDMPLVTPAILDRLIAAHDPAERKTIIVPTWQGRRGNPVLWDRRYFPSILSLSGDQGARGLLGQNVAEMAEMACDSDSVLQDFDTPEALGQEWSDPSD